MEDSKREYSEVEIEIAKNLLAKGYEWIARGKNDALFAYYGKPKKLESCWRSGVWQEFASFVPIFPQIKWEDEEPVRLRDIVQILTDEEREWLRTVVKPFGDRLKSVEVHDGGHIGRHVTFIVARSRKWGDDLIADDWLLPTREDWFKGMKDYKQYAPEELGI